MTSSDLPPRRPPDEKPRSSSWSIVMAAVGGLLFFAGLTLIAAPLVGVALGVAMVVGGICLVAFLHYIVWGYWLGDSIRREVEEEERDERARHGNS